MTLVNDLIELNRHVDVVKQLNKLLSIDPVLTKILVTTRHPVSKAYTESDEFVYLQDTEQDVPTAGLVGVLNGLVVDTANFRIAGCYDDNDELTHFVLLELQDGKFVEVK